MGEWISVEERLPQSGGMYLCYSPFGYWPQSVREWLPNEQAWEHEWLNKKRSEARPKTWITHWMPLPEPPK